MTIDDASLEERAYTRQHDRIFQALVQQVSELGDRVARLERSAGISPPPPADELDAGLTLSDREPTRRHDDLAPSAPLDLSGEIASIGSTLGDVKRRIEQSRRSSDGDAGWRSSSSRSAGWQPVATRGSRTG